MNEAETRAEHIDPALKSAGWGVVEAKAWDKPLTESAGQAKDYTGKLSVRSTYATNGQSIYGIDMDTGSEGELTGYPTPDELWNRTFATKNAWRDRFTTVPFEDRAVYFQGRYYQDIAIERVLEAITRHQSRILLTLATHWARGKPLSPSR